MCHNHQIVTFRDIYKSFVSIYVLYWEFLEIWCFGLDTSCSARSWKNFLDKQSEICHKRFSCEKISDLSEMHEIIKSYHSGHILDKYVSFYVLFWEFSEFWYFGLDSSCSARSWKIFLDKQSEICHKRFSCEKISDLSEMHEITKSYHSCHILHKYISFMCCFESFQSSDILA